MLNDSSELSSFPEFVRRNYWFFLLAGMAALCFRLFFLIRFPLLTNDSYVYGELAKNWLQHGVFGQTYATGPEPTYIRLPGYPLFLMLTWVVAGVEHYTAALIVQVLTDVFTCFVIADLARRIASERAAKAAFVLAALCPFFANYAAVALTETLSIFFAALAMDAAIAAFDQPAKKLSWAICGAALGAGILLRPDGGMLLAVAGAYALFIAKRQRVKLFLAGITLMGVLALAPLIPWTIRNWRTFHTFQPLAPFSASMPVEFVPHGFLRWMRTWVADYSSVEDVGFKVDGEEITIGDLPPRAYDGGAQRQRVVALMQKYVDNRNVMSPDIDAGFAELANERIRERPVRYYLVLPFLRAADLWLRPRTEMLPIDPHWWRLSEDDPPQFRWSVLLGAINVFYVIAALVALLRGHVRYAGFFIAFAVVRTTFLAWMPNPEPRYVLECYPALIAIAGAAFHQQHVHLLERFSAAKEAT